MHRFFVAPELVQQLDAIVTLPKELARQLRDVLHLQVGEQVALLDNSGDEVLATIASVSKSALDARLVERRAGKSESPVRIILCQGLLKSARFEWILEKGTELGVSVFSPVLCRRSMAGLEDAGTSKMQRWQRIITEAAEQSGRARLPALFPIRSLKDALGDIPPGALALMPWEEEQAVTLRDALRNPVHSKGGGGVEEGRGPLRSPSVQQLPVYHNQAPVHSRGGGSVDEGWGPLRSPSYPKTLPQSDFTITVVLFIGPEGGLTTDEVSLAQQHGAQVVSLGSRILRAETAALATVASVMYELEGEL
jgi:16S rRNA (uracil1498-N3)-methyltransferase